MVPLAWERFVPSFHTITFINKQSLFSKSTSIRGVIFQKKVTHKCLETIPVVINMLQVAVAILKSVFFTNSWCSTTTPCTRWMASKSPDKRGNSLLQWLRSTWPFHSFWLKTNAMSFAHGTVHECKLWNKYLAVNQLC